MQDIPRYRNQSACTENTIHLQGIYKIQISDFSHWPYNYCVFEVKPRKKFDEHTRIFLCYFWPFESICLFINKLLKGEYKRSYPLVSKRWFFSRRPLCQESIVVSNISMRKLVPGDLSNSFLNTVWIVFLFQERSLKFGIIRTGAENIEREIKTWSHPKRGNAYIFFYFYFQSYN